MRISEETLENFTITYPLDRLAPLERVLFLDIETTGFTAKSSYLYLIGCAYFLGERWRIADPIAALAVAACIFKVVFDLLRAGVDELLERSLPPATEDEIRRIAAGEAEVRSVRLLRTRRLGPAIAVELHLCVEGAMTVVRSHALSLRLERRLRERFGPDTLVVVHAEPCEPEAGHGAR